MNENHFLKDMKIIKKTEMIEPKVGSTLTEKKNDVHTCSITGRKYEGFGNNAYPFKGRCCDFANSHYVIPARIMDVTPEQIKQYGKEYVKLVIDQLHVQGKLHDFFYHQVEIQNSKRGFVKTVGMDEWLGHYQSDGNWTIQKDNMEGMFN